MSERSYRDISDTGGETERAIRLHEWLSFQQIEEMRQVFERAPNQKLNNEGFRIALQNFNIYLTDAEYQTLFCKINVGKDIYCDWDEFISFLIFGFQEDDPNNQKEDLTLPISDPPFSRKSGHRQIISSISFAIDTSADRSNDDESGSYVTGSKDGTVKFWSFELEPLRIAKSLSPYLKTTTTWVLSVEVMSDVRIICTSTTERELRFYDITATNFHLRMVITSVPFAICCLGYTFTNMNITSKLVLGDLAGNIRLFEFSPKLRGPFQSKPGTALIQLTWQELLKGKFPKIQVKDFLNVHVDVVRQVFFWQKHNLIFSAAECHTASTSISICPAVVVTDPKDGSKTIFNTPKGVTTFFVDEPNRILATGGPDAYLRLWDPFVPHKPTAILSGHHAGIVYVFIQPDEKKVYSIDHSKTIKVWNLQEQTLLQTFSDLILLLPHENSFVCYYNSFSRDLIVGARNVIRIKCCPKLRMDLTDGNTHAGPISVVLYNKLFQNIVTCGLDSYIIVWDPWTGKRQTLMKKAHVLTQLGQIVTVEITAACFDPREQLLLTGARDGSLKIWNFNNAVCIRNMTIEYMCEVTKVFWVPERILAVGWNQHVTEFADVEGQEYSDEKQWPRLHNDDITSGAIRAGQALVTGSHTGQLFFWKLETGQPYRQFNVEHPKQFIKLKYDPTEVERDTRFSEFRPQRVTRLSISKSRRFFTESHADKNGSNEAFQNLDNVGERVEVPFSVQAILFLETRTMSKNHGTLLVALDNGMIQVYSHHQRGGFIKEFYTIHKTGDCVISMTTDERNHYLITGTAFGYIKIWLMRNFCIPENEKRHICMPKLRLQFIFLRRDRFPGRAKRMATIQAGGPMLLSSFKGHLKSVTSIVYIEHPKIIVTGSHDCSCRLWTLGGRYINTLGSPIPWIRISPLAQINEEDTFRIPPDIQKVASSTTLKVITGVYKDRYKQLKEETKMQEIKKTEVETFSKCVYGKSLKEPLLGKHFELPPRTRFHHQPVLDKSLPYIPVYAHLQVHEAIPLERPPTPTALKKTKKLEFMEYYKPNKK